MTADDADISGDVFSADCPARAILDVLAGKWALLLIHALIEGPARPSELRRRVGGISEKMLIQTLRLLERHGLVRRHSYAEVPPRVEYSLNELGVSLSELVSALDDWVERHASEIDGARRSFDGNRKLAPSETAGGAALPFATKSLADVKPSSIAAALKVRDSCSGSSG